MRLLLLIGFVALVSCKHVVNEAFVVIEMPNIKTNLFLKGARLNDVSVVESNEGHKIDGNNRIVLNGGEVLYKNFIIKCNKGGLFINNNKIETDASKTSNYVLNVDGNVQPGFLRNFE